MQKTILTISSSPRKGGNSDLLCDEFAKGAHEAGHATGENIPPGENHRFLYGVLRL